MTCNDTRLKSFLLYLKYKNIAVLYFIENVKKGSRWNINKPNILSLHLEAKIFELKEYYSVR